MILEILICILLFKNTVSSPITNPLVSDKDIDKVIPDYFDSKRFKDYHNMSPDKTIKANEVKQKIESNVMSEFRLRWSTSVGSPVYSTPVVFPSGPHGKKQIFVNSYYQFIDLLNDDGFKSWGWPLTFEGSSFQSSPLLYDIDGDGNVDVGATDKNGNMYWIRIGEAGEYLEDYHIQVPKLKVKRNWADGIDPKFGDSYTMLSMFDRRGTHQMNQEEESNGQPSRSSAKLDVLNPKQTRRLSNVNSHSSGREMKHRRLQETSPEANQNSIRVAEQSPDQQQEQILLQQQQEQQTKEQEQMLLQQHQEQQSPDQSLDNEPDLFHQNNVQQESVDDDDDDYYRGKFHREEGEQIVPDFGEDGAFSQLENEVFSGEDDFDEAAAGSAVPGSGEEVYGLPGMYLDDDKATREGEESGYGSYAARVRGGMDDALAYYMGRHYGGFVNDSEYIHIDAHVLSSPVLVDVNGDGHLEILFSVSYYFDKADYATQQIDFDPDLYVAGGIACWDLQEEYWSWLVHLDLTTSKSQFQAMIYSSPTVADLDGDGRLEVIIGTALGLLYVLDGESGFVRRFFPMQFHSIQAQIAVGDITGGRDLEMVVADMGGTVALVNSHGDVLWDIQLSGQLPFTPTIGDVDGDGQLDIVVVAATEHIETTSTKHHHHRHQKNKTDTRGETTSIKKGSHIFAIRGDTGELLPGYPISLPENAAVSSPVLLVDLHEKTSQRRFQNSGNGTSTASKRKSMTLLDVDQPFSVYSNEDEDKDSGVRWPGDGRKGLGGTISAKDARRPLGLHLVVTSYDGNVYIIDGASNENSHKTESATTTGVKGEHTTLRPHHSKFSAQRIDIGEHVYSVPLLDDITGDGYMNLLIGTLNGQVLLFESSVPHHTVNSWSSFPKHRANAFTHGDLGISVPHEEKQRLQQFDVKTSSNLSFVFDIWDAQYWKHSVSEIDKISYTVSVTKGTDRLQVLWSQTFTSPGRYTAYVPVSPPELALLVVSMVSDHGIYFEDAVYISLSTHFYVWIKYMLICPVLLLSLTLLSRFRKYL